MNFLGGLKKGFKLGDDKAGPLGGLLGALGGGTMGLLGMSAGDGGGVPAVPAQRGSLSLGDRMGNLAAGLGAAQNFADGDFASGAQAMRAVKRAGPAGPLPELPDMPELLAKPVGSVPLYRRRSRNNLGF